MLENLFTKLPPSISKKMIAAGIELTAWMRGNSYYILLHKYKESNSCDEKGIFYSSNIKSTIEKYLHEIKKNKNFIPAWTAGQLWDYIETLPENNNHRIDFEIRGFRSIKITIVDLPKTIGDKWKYTEIKGNLTDPSVPAKVLEELERRGLLG